MAQELSQCERLCQRKYGRLVRVVRILALTREEIRLKVLMMLSTTSTFASAHEEHDKRISIESSPGDARLGDIDEAGWLSG